MQTRRIHRNTQQTPTQMDQFRLPAGIGAMIGIVVFVWIFFAVPPDAVRDFLFKGFYLPMLFLGAVIIFSIVFFLFLNVRRAFTWSVFGFALFFLLFQNILSFYSFLYILLPFVVIEAILTYSRK